MKRQQGATLAVTLLLLFVITLLGVSAMQVTHMQEKMSTNLHDKELSFNAAESALAAGEAWLMSLSTEPAVVASCATFPCVRQPFENLDFTVQTNGWWQTNAAAYSSSLTNVNTPPRYFIEFLQSVDVTGSNPVVTEVYYQVTARGSGSSDDSASILQSTLKRSYNGVITNPGRTSWRQLQ